MGQLIKQKGRPKTQEEKFLIATTVSSDVINRITVIAKDNQRSRSGQLKKIIDDWLYFNQNKENNKEC
jgi:hypothetical protein